MKDCSTCSYSVVWFQPKNEICIHSCLKDVTEKFATHWTPVGCLLILEEYEIGGKYGND